MSSEDPSGRTPLHLAARRGHCSIVTMLLAAGADARAVTLTGLTPLHLGAMNGHLSIVYSLLESDDSAASALDNSGCSALHWAAMEGHEDTVEALLAAGADATVKNKRNASPADWAKKHPALVTRLKQAATAQRLSRSAG